MNGVQFFFFKQKTAYEIKECDWSSDVCSSDLSTLNLPSVLLIIYFLSNSNLKVTGKLISFAFPETK